MAGRAFCVRAVSLLASTWRVGGRVLASGTRGCGVSFGFHRCQGFSGVTSALISQLVGKPVNSWCGFGCQVLGYHCRD